MKFTLATKQHMTEFFSEDGKVHPATVLKATPLTVTAVKTTERDGYEAIQVGSGVQKKERVSKALRGHLKDQAYKRLRNFVLHQETFKLERQSRATSSKRGMK
jgi:large subunit ribosomal protein L3